MFRLRHTVVDQMHMIPSAMFLGYQVFDDIRDDDYLISKLTSEFLAHSQCPFCLPPPFVAVVVRPMVRKHHFQPQHLGNRNHQSRADGMHMQHISP